MTEKTNKSILKRFKIKKNKLYRKKAFRSHLLNHKSKSRLRRLTKTIYLPTKFIPKFKFN